VTTQENVTGGNGALTGNASYVYRTLQNPSVEVPGGGGTLYKIDSTNFPMATTLAATFVELTPGSLREVSLFVFIELYGAKKRASGESFRVLLPLLHLSGSPRKHLTFPANADHRTRY
jgi:hypothetical protein